MKKFYSFLGTSLVALTPMMALAQFGDVDAFFGNINAFISGTLVPFVFALALLVFLWGMFRAFILKGGDESSREEGKQLMLWAIIAFVVMVSIFGIVNLLSGGLGLDDEELDTIPDTPITNT